MPNYLSRMKPNGANGTEYKLKDEELREAFDVFKDDIKGTQTATGNPITLTDASETYAQGLSVELEPKQDLHGYDFPWVGGAGKNLFDKSNVQNGALDSNGNVYTNPSDTRRVSDYIEIDPNTVYYLSNAIDLTNGRTGFWYDSNKTAISQISFPSTVQKSGAITSPNNAKYAIICVPSATLDTAQLELGSTATSWEPYSNICPISGYEGVEVEDVGVNQWDEEVEIGDIDASTGQNKQATGTDFLRSKNYIKVTPNTEYYGKFVYGAYVYKYDASYNYLGYIPSMIVNGVFTVPNDTYYIRFVLSGTYGTTYNHDISINYPAADTNYHRHQSRTASVTFGQTVYGGRSDFTEGKTEKTHKCVDMGDLTYSVQSGGNSDVAVITGLAQEIKVRAHDVINFMCSGYRPSDLYDWHVNGAITVGNVFGGNFVNICNSDFVGKTNEQVKAMMAGLQFYYEIVTPENISTPPTDLKLLQDTNNLTTNGTTITLDYIPNNSIGDAVKASEEYTDRAVERVIPKAKLACFYEIFDESGTLYDANIPEDCNFFLVEYRIQNRIGSTLIKAKSIDFYIPVVVNVGGEQHWVEFLYNSIYHTIDYTSNVTTGFGVLSIYTI